MPRKSVDVGAEGQLRLPTFGGLLRRLRDDREISREKLAFAAGVSASYITHLESGDRDRPTRAVVEALIRYLDRIAALTDAERRHVFDLAGLVATEFPGIVELRADITDQMRRALTLQEPNLAGYLDTRWNVLACNDAYAAVFPGLLEDVNVLRWFFGNELSKQTMVEWEREATLTVQLLRGLIGQQGDTEWSTELLAELAEFPEFRRIWAEGGAAYGRDRSAMHIRDLDSGSCYSVDVHMFRLDSGNYPGRIQYCLGIRTACSPTDDARVECATCAASDG